MGTFEHLQRAIALVNIERRYPTLNRVMARVPGPRRHTRPPTFVEVQPVLVVPADPRDFWREAE